MSSPVIPQPLWIDVSRLEPLMVGEQIQHRPVDASFTDSTGMVVKYRTACGLLAEEKAIFIFPARVEHMKGPCWECFPGLRPTPKFSLMGQWITGETGCVMSMPERLHDGTYRFFRLCTNEFGEDHVGFVRVYDGSFPVCPLCVLAGERL